MYRVLFLLSQLIYLSVCLSWADPLTTATNPHNLSSTSTNAVRATSETRICVFCHTPHGAVAQTALWNRDDPDKFGAFNVYASGTLNIDDVAGLYPSADYPNGASRMCLSCHDGVTAIGDVLNNSTINMTIATLTGRSSEIDLSSSHPISFVYDAATVASIAVAEGGANYQLSADADVVTDNADRMQCTTCHDPHEDTRSGAYDLPFWSNYSGAGNDASDYDDTCQACHLGVDWGGSWGGALPLPGPIH